MDIYYINLDESTERRVAIEKNLRQTETSKFSLHRVSAFDRNYVNQQGILGSIRDTEKACFLSHIKAIEMSVQKNGYALIIEDDIYLGNKSLSKLIDLIDSLTFEVDLLFAEICVSSLQSMFQLYSLKQQYSKIRTVQILKTSLFDFAGATAYVLNQNSKLKLLNYLKKISIFNSPYDLVLKKLIIENAISSGFTFPFVATLNSHSLNTGIQLPADELPNVVYHAFRKLMYLEEDSVGRASEDLQRINKDFYSQEDLIFGQIISTLMSKKFPEDVF